MWRHLLVLSMVGPRDLKHCKINRVLRLSASSSRSWVSTCVRGFLASPLLAAVSKPAGDPSCQAALKGTAVKYLPTSEGNLKSLEHLRQEEPLMWQDCDSYMWFEHPATRNCPLAPLRSHWSLRGCCFPISCRMWVLIPLLTHVPKGGCLPVITVFWCSLVLN